MTRPLRILLVLPDSHMHTLGWGRYRRSMREAPLTLTTLAALAPAELEIQWRLVDGTVEPIPMDAECDLVGISVMTGTADEGYAVADHYRARGASVVIGGVHTTLRPDEAADHADAVVIGMAERTWPRLLRDFATGQLQPRYHEADEAACISLVPTPRRDLMRRHRYNIPNTVMASRGCRRACRFCSVPTVWSGHHRRPVAHVIRDVASARSRLLAIADVNLLEERDAALELLAALAPLRRVWGGLATMDTADDPEMMEALRASGCRFLLVGMESVSAAALGEIRKGFNRIERYRHQVQAFHDAGISVQACLIFGFDHDGPQVFDETVEMVRQMRIDIPRYSLLTPYPGTDLYESLRAEGRLISETWSDYDTMHVVFEPARMSPWQLYDGFREAYRRTFTSRHMLSRLAGPSARSVLNLIGNLTYRRFVRRLYREPRFAAPNSVMRKSG